MLRGVLLCWEGHDHATPYLVSEALCCANGDQRFTYEYPLKIINPALGMMPYLPSASSYHSLKAMSGNVQYSSISCVEYQLFLCGRLSIRKQIRVWFALGVSRMESRSRRGAAAVACPGPLYLVVKAAGPDPCNVLLYVKD